MGSPISETGRLDVEGPQRIVKIEAFEVGTFTVTMAEFDLFVAASGYPVAGMCQLQKSTGWELVTGSFRSPGAHPAVFVSWDDAQAFVSRQFQKWKGNRNLLLENGRHEKRVNSHRHPPEPMPSAAGGGPARWREFPAFQRRPSTAGCATGQGPAPAVPGLFPRLRNWSVDSPTGP